MKHNFLCFLSVICLLFTTRSMLAQTFKKLYGTSQYEEFWGSCILSDGTMVHAGYSLLNAYILRTNAVGDTLWTRSIPESAWGLLYSVQQSSDQGIIVAGRSSSYGAGLMDVYLMKLNIAGQILWRKAIGTAVNETANEVKLCQDKGFLIAGYTKVPNGNNNSNDAYVVKTDSLGNVQWTKAFHGIANSNAYDIAEMVNGDIIVVGLTLEPTVDVFIARLGPTGIIKWKNKYDSGGDDRGMELIINAQCDIFVTGLYSATQMLLMKVDSSGNLQWGRSYAGSTNQWAYSICEAGGGNMAICGYGSGTGPSASTDYLLIKTNSNGDTLWTRLHGTPLTDYAQKVNKTSDGGFVISGYSRRNASSDYDLLVVRTNSLGNTICESRPAAVTVNTISLLQSVSSLSVASLGTTVAVTSSATSLGTVEVVCASCTTPTLSITTTHTVLCIYQTATLTASGAFTYTWNPGGTGTSISISPTVVTTYSIVGTSSTGCVNSTTFTQNVTVCDGIQHLQNENSAINIYPNPFETKFTIVGTVASSVQIFNSQGTLLYSGKIEKEINEIDLTGFSNGLYLLRIGALTKKIIKN